MKTYKNAFGETMIFLCSKPSIFVMLIGKESDYAYDPANYDIKHSRYLKY